MIIEELDIKDSWLISPNRHLDDRGWFQEWYKQSTLFKATGFEFIPVQANISSSSEGVIRGIHYSLARQGQGKLVTVLSGEIDDYVVDIRPSSTTFGKWTRVRLSASNGNSVLLSPHLGHCFHSLTDDTVVCYLVTAEFNPDLEKGINPLCPHLSISWTESSSHLIAAKDRQAPDLITQLNSGQLPDNL